MKELTGSFEDFKEIVPKAGERLKLKKHLREDFAVTCEPGGSSEISLSPVPPESNSVQALQPPILESIQHSSTMCKYTHSCEPYKYIKGNNAIIQTAMDLYTYKHNYAAGMADNVT